ncbi:helix-turn-helix domain-containing protein [Paenibacillus sp. WQ 127069]|uniref:Helix-turn-helix domain-containing protein n=1 Tax=Paenibacillus baimaensis TaxID=2982185 RepID=A0ABT2UL06_9BACL|nr:helix-turn-helix domain-containing protein [Paenibacillus sp. WQ 127069]MCU6794726.1 helix-turn-helix domain-containing protein [Paenibacillus sp. WQ 127069]
MRTKNPWFFKLITTYLPILYVVVLALSFLFFMTLSDLSNKQTVKSNEAFTKYVTQRLDSLLENIDQITITEINSDKELQNYMFQKYDDASPYLLNSAISNRFSKIKMSFPMIHSIYFYRISDQSILSLESMHTLDRFPDRDFIVTELEKPFSSYWTDKRQYKEFETQASAVPVLSLVKKLPMFTNPYGMLVINIDINAFQALLQDMSKQTVSYVKLFDKQENLLASSNEAGGRDLYSLRSSVSNLEIRSGLKDGYEYGLLSELYSNWIIAGMILVLLATISTIYLSKRYARPIDASVNRISDFFSKQQIDNTSRELLHFVDSAVDQIIDYANRYQSQSDTNLLYRKKHFFHELLDGDREIDKVEYREEMKSFGLQTDGVDFAVILVEIDRMSDFSHNYSYRDQYLLKFVITNVWDELAAEQDLKVWSEWMSAETLGVMFSSESRFEEAQSAQMIAIGEQLRAWVETNLKFTVTIGVGTTLEQLPGIRKSFQQAKEALQLKTSIGNNRVIVYKETVRQTEAELFDLLELTRSITQLYKSGNEDWRKQFEYFFTVLGKGGHTSKEIINLINYMCFTFTKELSDFPAEYVEMWKQTALGPMTEALQIYETAEEIKQTYLAVLIQVEENWKGIRESRNNRHLIYQVRQYIEENYANSDMSLQLLSEQFGMNKSYVSRIFKDEFGENFVDYLAGIRIQHAKQMLEDTQLPIQDIAVQIGYVHYFTFIRAFKKLIGISPSDYRKK